MLFAGDGNAAVVSRASGVIWNSRTKKRGSRLVMQVAKTIYDSATGLMPATTYSLTP